MQKYTLDEFNQKFGGGSTTPVYTPPKAAAPSVFNFGAAKDVFTKAWEDTAIGIAESKKNNNATGIQTAVIQGGLSPFRALGAGLLGSEQGQAVTQGADIGGKLAKAGEYTPDFIKKSVGPILLESLQGYESKSPEEQLKVRNQLGIAEGLFSVLGVKVAKDVFTPGKNFAGEYAAQQAAKGTASESVTKSATGIREQIRSVIGEGSVDPQFKTSVTRVTNNPNYFLEGTGLRVEDAVNTYARYAPLAEKAANDIQQDPPIGIVGEKIGDSFDAVIKQRQDVGKALGEEVKAVGNLRVEIVDSVKGLLEELRGSGLSYNPRTRQLTSFQGSAFVSQEIDMLSQFIARVNLLGQSPSVRDLNNFITRTRTELEFTKGASGVMKTTNAERIINSGLANLTESLNPEVNGISQLAKYWNARKTYSDLSDFVEEGSGFLGKKTQSGDYAKDASIAKSSVQSILNGGKKDWLVRLEELTGYNALDDIVIALQAMKDAGDFRGLSLLQAMKDNGIPLTKAGVGAALIEGSLALGKRVVAGKPSEQTLAFLKKLSDEAKAGKTDLTKADPIVKAKAGTPKNKEVVALEKKIEANVKAQREALKTGDLTLLQKLKNIYRKLVEALKAEIKLIKDNIGNEQGFANFGGGDVPKNYRKVGDKMGDIKRTSPEKMAADLIEDDIPMANKLYRKDWGDIDSAQRVAFMEKYDLVGANETETKKFLKEALDEYDARWGGVEDAMMNKKVSDIQPREKNGQFGEKPKPAGIKEPTLKTKREVIAKDMAGNKVIIPQGEVITPYINGAKVNITVGNKSYVIPKNQYQNLVGQSDVAKATPFAPELEGTVETVKGSKYDKLNRAYTEYQDELRKKYGINQYQNIPATPEETAKLRELSGAINTSDLKTKYSQYTLPGGENYREILIQAPSKTGELTPAKQALEELKKDGITFEDDMDGMTYPVKDGETVDYDSLTARQRSLMDTAIGDATDTSSFKRNLASEYQSSHWSEPNVISHLRMNERTVDGKKYAFMEELQSDWAREGRDKGFIQDIPKPTLPVGMRMTNNGDTWKVVDKDGKIVPNKLTGEGDAYAGSENVALAKAVGDDSFIKAKNGVPNNPLLKNWQILTTKRALMEAVDSGADRFAWINGEQTSARYNLATHVEEVGWKQSASQQDRFKGRKYISIRPKDSNSIIDFEIKPDGEIDVVNYGHDLARQWRGKKLDEVLGKGLADKIMEKETGTLSGDGLSFGGEWASNLYDRQVRDIVKKLTGAEVKDVDLGLGDGTKRTKFIKQSGKDVGGALTKNDLKVGLVINEEGVADFVITKVLGDGKFKAVKQSFYEQFSDLIRKKDIKDLDEYFGNNQREFDISKKDSTQQYIDLTPEVKAKIQSKAPDFKMKNPSAGESLPLLLLLLGGGAVASS